MALSRGLKVTAIIALVAAWLVITPQLLLPKDLSQPTTLLFDGVCNLCNGLVHFVADHDPKNHIKMGAIQHHPQLIEELGAPGDLSTVIVVQDGIAYTHSIAVLRLLALLEPPLNTLSAFAVVPSFIRDFVYRQVGASRYAVFGQSDVCRAPTPELEARFLEPEPDAEAASASGEGH